MNSRERICLNNTLLIGKPMLDQKFVSYERKYIPPKNVSLTFKNDSRD